MKINLTILFFGCLFITFSCCRKKPVEPVDFKYEYFPQKIGSYIVYDVMEVQYDPEDTNIEIDTINYQLKEKIESSFSDAQGRISYRIERYSRPNDSMPWQLASPVYVYYSTVTKSTAERIEDNLRFIKLTFPPYKEKKWSGNVFITSQDSSLFWYKDWEYAYTEVDVPLQINNFHFDSTLTVVGINDTTDNIVEGRFAFEQYAKNVGLVYKKVFHLEYRVSSIDIPLPPWEARANHGFIIEMKMDTFGNE